MKVVFAGTPEFARVALRSLDEAGFEIPLVLTQPDRPAGRGLKLQASPVKQYALGRGMPVAQPRSLRLDGKYPEDAASAREALEAAGADAMVVAAYGLILPQWVLDLPRLGCLNIHASLLPRWRGAAPIHRAIEAGDAETGVTIMQMDAGLDTGAMLLAQSVAIGEDNTARLHDRLAAIGGQLIVEALRQAGRGALHAVAQPAEGVSYAHKIDKAEAQLDWSLDARTLSRRIRAFDPAPGAGSTLQGVAVKVWAADARPGASGAVPGTVLAATPAGIEVATGEGALVLTELQRAGGKRLPVADFLRGFDVGPGQVFGLMFFSAAIRRQPEFREGMRDTSSVALGLGAWGLMTGVAMLKSGMSVFEAIAMTLLVYAGSSQLAAIPLLIAGAPAWVVLATGFCVNLRFVVFSLHLRPYFMHMPRWRRMTHGYLTADMTYAYFTRKFPQPPVTEDEKRAQEAYITGNYCMTWITWMAMSMIGIFLANMIPTQWGLGFAGVLSLVAVVCSMTTSRLRALAVAVAGATAVAAYALPLKLNIVVAIGVAVLLCFWLEKQFGLDPDAEDDR